MHFGRYVNHSSISQTMHVLFYIIIKLVHHVSDHVWIDVLCPVTKCECHMGSPLRCIFSLLSHTRTATHGIGNFLLPSSEVMIMGLSCSSSLNVKKYRNHCGQPIHSCPFLGESY